jgi:hypothetical protein
MVGFAVVNPPYGLFGDYRCLEKVDDANQELENGLKPIYD